MYILIDSRQGMKIPLVLSSRQVVLDTGQVGQVELLTAVDKWDKWNY